MANNEEKSRKRGGAGKAILCFFLGFILAIVVEFGLIAGGVYWLYTSDLASVFTTLGIDNTEEDESGQTSYIYINTSEISSISALVSELSSLANKGTDSLTLGDLENFPIVDTVIDTIYGTVADLLDVTEDYVRERIDEDELKDQPLSGLIDYVVDCVKGFGLDVVFNLITDIEDEDNSLYLALIYGGQAATVTYDGDLYVLYYDSFTYDEDTSSYIRSDGETLDSDYEQYLFSSASDYKLYYMIATNGTAYVVTRSSGEYSFAIPDTSAAQTASISLTAASASSSDTLVAYNPCAEATLSGSYYTVDNGDGTTTYVYLSEAKTLGDLLDGVDNLLYDVYLTDFISDSTLVDMFDGLSIGDLMKDENISDSILENIYLTEFLDEDSDPLLTDIFNGKSLSDILNSDDVVTDLFSDIYISDLFDEDADESLKAMFDGYTVADILNGNFTMDDIAIGDIMAANPENAIMSFIVYSVSNLQLLDNPGTITVNGEDVEYTYTATLHLFGEDEYGNETHTTCDAYVVTETDAEGDTSISAVYYLDNSEYVSAPAVTINDISAQTDRLMDYVPIGEITDLGDSSIAIKLSGYTINQVDQFIDELTLEDVIGTVTMDDSAIIKYITYGISDISTTYDEEGNTRTYTATYHDYDGNEYPATVVAVYDDDEQAYVIQSVFYTVSYTDGTEEITEEIAASTLVNDISDRIDGLMSDLTIGEIAGKSLDTEGKLAYKLSGYTVDTINDFIDSLTLEDVIEEVTVKDENATDSDSSVIMDYIVYGLTDVTSLNKTVNGYNLYSAVYHTYDATADDGVEYDVTVCDNVYLLVDSALVIYGIYADQDCNVNISELLATPVNSVTARMNGLMNDLTIGELVDNTSNSVILNAISDATINNLSETIDELAIQEVFYDQIYSEVAAAGSKNEDGATVDSFLRVVYESITGGTYYYYTAAVAGTEGNEDTPASLTEVSGDTSSYLAAGTLYWTDGESDVIYQVVQYTDDKIVCHLFLDSDMNYVEISGSERGHIDSTDALAEYVKSYGILYTYGKPEGTWYFMLYSDGVECVYSVDHVEALTTNATKNIELATLRELKDAGILNLSEEQLAVPVSTTYFGSLLEKYSKAGVVEGGAGSQYVLMENLYLTDTISIFINALDAIQNLQENNSSSTESSGSNSSIVEGEGVD